MRKERAPVQAVLNEHAVMFLTFSCRTGGMSASYSIDQDYSNFLEIDSTCCFYSTITVDLTDLAVL